MIGHYWAPSKQGTAGGSLHRNVLWAASGSRAKRLCWLLFLVIPAGCNEGGRRSSKQEPPVARVLKVTSESEADAISAPGVVSFRHEVPLGFITAGRIGSVLVEEGDRVRAGQLLASLDAAPDLAARDASAAERIRAEAAYQRSAALKVNGWVTQAAVDGAVAALRTARANERSTSFRLLHSRIYASGPGVVLTRSAEPGQVAEAGRPVLVLGEEGAGYVLRVALSDRRAAMVTPGASAQVIVDALGSVILSGQVVEIGAAADAATGTFQLKIAIPPESRLRAGQVGTASITTSRHPDQRIAIPPSAIFSARAGVGFVHLVDIRSGRISNRRVLLGEIAGDHAVPVVSGLRPGDWVVVSNTRPLGDGDVIRPSFAS